MAPEQTPWLQVWPGGHMTLQPPQLWGSVRMLLQVVDPNRSQQSPTVTPSGVHAPGPPSQPGGRHWVPTQTSCPRVQSNGQLGWVEVVLAQITAPAPSFAHTPEQISPQAEQFAGSWASSTQAPLQHVPRPPPFEAPSAAPKAQAAPVTPGPQVASRQLPPMHTASSRQLCTTEHPPEPPSGARHPPWEQRSPAGHSTPQAPQLVASNWGFTQLSAQQAPTPPSPRGHATPSLPAAQVGDGRQLPPTQKWLGPQVTPQLPQNWVSDVVSTHALPQQVPIAPLVRAQGTMSSPEPQVCRRHWLATQS